MEDKIEEAPDKVEEKEVLHSICKGDKYFLISWSEEGDTVVNSAGVMEDELIGIVSKSLFVLQHKFWGKPE